MFVEDIGDFREKQLKTLYKKANEMYRETFIQTKKAALKVEYFLNSPSRYKETGDVFRPRRQKQQSAELSVSRTFCHEDFMTSRLSAQRFITKTHA